MQVLVLDRDHDKRARYHSYVHLNKLLTESVQILNTVLYRYGLEDVAFYDETHETHPWVVWASKTVSNWRWLREHALALGREYEQRKGERQAAHEKLRSNWDRTVLATVGDVLPDGHRTPFPFAFDDTYVRDDPVESYRAYVRNEKAEPKYGYVEDPPEWW